jgi:hypothetical protein
MEVFRRDRPRQKWVIYHGLFFFPEIACLSVIPRSPVLNLLLILCIVADPQNSVDTVNVKNRSQLTKEANMQVKDDKHQSMKQGYVPASAEPVRIKPSDPETAKWKPPAPNSWRKMKNGTDWLEIPDKVTIYIH